MYLAEAIREKDFVIKSIEWLCGRIEELSVSSHDSDVKLNQELIKNKIKELENLYKELQKYSIIISRAKVMAKIKLNDEDFSIADAENILEAMRDRLKQLSVIINSTKNTKLYASDPKIFVCINLEDIYLKVFQLRSDIRAIEVSIERALWSMEV